MLTDYEDDDRPVDFRDRVELILRTILQTTPDAVAAIPRGSLMEFIQANFDEGVLDSPLSAVLKLAMETRIEPEKIHAWIHAGDDESPFDRVQRPRGRPGKNVSLNLRRASSQVEKLEREVAFQQGLIDDAELSIQAARRRIAALEFQIKEEVRFLGASSFYLLLEAVAAMNAKALALGPMFPIAVALGDAPDKDRIAFVLRQLHDDWQMQRELTAAVREVTEHNLRRAVLARQAEDPEFDPNAVDAFKPGKTAEASQPSDGWFGGAEPPARKASSDEPLLPPGIGKMIEEIDYSKPVVPQSDDDWGLDPQRYSGGDGHHSDEG
jgi:hypothetical protein